MAGSSPIDRRAATALIGAAGVAAAGALPAVAQTIAEPWQALVALTREAEALGISVSKVTPPANGTANYRELAPAILDFIDDVDDVADGGGPNAPAAKTLLRRAQELLSRVGRQERSPRQKGEAAPATLFGLLGFVGAAQAQAADRFRNYHDGYLQLFDGCLVRTDFQDDVKLLADRILADKNRKRYVEVETAVCAPWWFVAVVHNLEASLNFGAHLHNGDPLSRRTTHEPPGLPRNWDPPGTWLDSAKDALAHDKMTGIQDWSLAATLYRWEAYNGFRTREVQNLNSPYVWSFSNHYTRGKYVEDGVWSATTVSQQCGAGVLLHELVSRGAVRFG